MIIFMHALLRSANTMLGAHCTFHPVCDFVFFLEGGYCTGEDGVVYAAGTQSLQRRWRCVLFLSFVSVSPLGVQSKICPKCWGKQEKVEKQEERLLTVCWDMLAKQLCVGEKWRHSGAVISNLLSPPALILGMLLGLKKKKNCFVCFFFNGLLRDVILIFTFCFGVFLGGCFLCCICASHGACWPSNEFSGWSEILKSKIKRKVGTAQLWGCGFCLETHSSRDVCPKKNPSEAEMQTWLRRSFSHTSMPFGKSELVRKEKRALNSEFSLAWVLGTENLRVIIRGEKKPLSALFHPQYSLSIPFWLPSPMFGPQTPDLST